MKRLVVVVTLAALLGAVSCKNGTDPIPEGDKYIFYATWGTLGTLYAGLHMHLHSYPSYVWFERTATLSTTKLPSHAVTVGTIGDIATASAIGEKVRELHDANPEADFVFYVDDLRAVRATLEWFFMQGVTEDHLKVYMLSDGAASYGYFSQQLGADGSAANLAADKAAVDGYIASAKAGTVSWTAESPRYVDLQLQSYAFSEKSWVEYWLQYPELMTSADASVTAEKSSMHLTKKMPSSLWEAIDLVDERSQFLEAVALDKASFDAMFAAADKPNLIVSGTNLDGVGTNPTVLTYGDSFKTLMGEVKTQYEGTYDMFFKPHPSRAPAGDDLAYITGTLGFTVLPATLPMEVILWVYPDLKIGGYPSSLYMSSAAGQTIFFVNAADKTALPAPLPALYDLNHFPGSIFITL